VRKNGKTARLGSKNFAWGKTPLIQRRQHQNDRAKKECIMEKQSSGAGALTTKIRKIVGKHAGERKKTVWGFTN